MADCIIKVWKLVGCFAAGWVLMMIGAGVLQIVDFPELIGILCLIGGLALMPLPSVLMVWSGCGLGELFNTEYFIETTYADGHKTTEYDLGGTMISQIITLIIAFALGVIITPIRILIGVVAFLKAKKDLGIDSKDIPMTQNIWFPFVVALASFVGGIILSLTISSIAHAAYDLDQHTGDYTTEQMTTMVETWETQWANESYEYTLNGGYEAENNKCAIKVTKTGGTYVFTVSNTRKWDDTVEETGGYVDTTEGESPLPFGTYTYTVTGDTWTNADGLDDADKAMLKGCTMESIVDKIMAMNPILKNDETDDGKEGYDLIGYFKVDGEEGDVRLEVAKEGNKPCRLVGDGGSGIYGVGGFNIMFE